MKRNCEICGAAFNTAPANVRAGNGRFCSQECFQVTQRTRVERSCEQCGARFLAKPAEIAKSKGRFCSRPCFDLSRRGPKKADVQHRMMRAKGHPLAPPSGTVAISRITLYDRIGPGEHPCHWCETLVEWQVGTGVRYPDVLVVDHLDHDPTNDDPANLVPSCNSCNAHRRITGTSAIIQPGEIVKVHGDGTRSRGIERRCEQCGGIFITKQNQLDRGKGRFCSRSCARRSPRVAQ